MSGWALWPEHAFGQNSADINTHALKEKREEDDYPSLFCFDPSRARPFVQQIRVRQGGRARLWMLIKRSEECMVYGSFDSVMWNLL